VAVVDFGTRQHPGVELAGNFVSASTVDIMAGNMAEHVDSEET